METDKKYKLFDEKDYVMGGFPRIKINNDPNKQITRKYHDKNIKSLYEIMSSLNKDDMKKL
jgi:hypothetical protein